MTRFDFFPILRPKDIAAAWTQCCAELDPPDLAFGPEWREPRPRAGEKYFTIWDGHHLARGQPCGDGSIGLLWVAWPGPTTTRFGMGLWPACRGQGLGPAAADAIYDFLFSDLGIHKVESEVYSSNPHSLAALHGPKAPRRYRAREEGRQRAAIAIGDRYYDRVLFGYDRDEWWAAQREGQEG